MEGNPSPAFTQFLGPLSRKRPTPFGFQKTSSGFRVLVIFPPPGQKNQNLRLCQVRTCRECPEALLSPVAALELQTVVCFFPLHFMNGPQVQVLRGRIFTNTNWITSFFGCFHPTWRICAQVLIQQEKSAETWPCLVPETSVLIGFFQLGWHMVTPNQLHQKWMFHHGHPLQETSL